MIGTSLGPYKIIEQLGAGGMGEVYLGEDTRLGRKVAIKVLPEEYASDPERLARFEQEARAAAALNHPHIAAVFDVGAETTEGSDVPTHFIVQEYLQGQSLRERLEKRAQPLDKALDLATEVGEALIAAGIEGVTRLAGRPAGRPCSPSAPARSSRVAPPRRGRSEHRRRLTDRWGPPHRSGWRGFG